ncbi:uncharacterized protein LOC134695801 [Mytilus trossulus]|uniref:uncharacterized protein LOC134695801 n=1 Tax=Mytilus trossulus TaxID=6551 RepID=UPI0030067071
MSQYIFTNYSVTEDLTTEDEGFNSREEDSIYNSSPRTPRTEEDRETASIVSTDIVEESTTETVQSYSDTISNSDSDSVDSFSSIESQIEQFFQYQRENREKFGGILEQQISRLRREQFDPEFPERKCFTEDSTQTTYVENKSLSAICTYVKALRELISEKIQADDITDLEENLQHWYRTLSEHAEDIGLTEEDKERLIHGKQDELSEIIQNIIDRYNVRVISSGENMWSADKLSPRSLTQAARKYDSSNLKESDRKYNTQKDNSQFSQYMKKYESPETSKQGKYLSSDRDKKASAQLTNDHPQIQTSKLSYPEAGRQNKRYNPIPSSSAYEQYDSKASRQRKLSEYGENPYSDPLERISQKYDLIKSKPRDDLLTRQPQNQTSSKQLSNPEADRYNKRYNPIPSSSAYEQYDSKTSRQRKLSVYGEKPYSDPLERISQKYDLIKSKPRDDLLTRQKELSDYEPSERMFQKYTMKDRKPVDDLTSEKYSSTTKPSGIDRYKDSYKDMTSSIPGNNQFRERSVINARAQPVDSFSRKEINRSQLFKDDKLATSREKPKQNIVDNEPTEDEIVQNILDAAYKKELKSTRLPQETNMNDQRSTIIPKGQRKLSDNGEYTYSNPIDKQRKLSDNGEYTYSNPIDKVSKAYDLIKNKPRDDQFTRQDENIGYAPSDKMFQKSSTKDRKQLDYPTSQKNSSLTKPSKIDRHEDSYQMKSLMPADNQIRKSSVINSREYPVDTFRQKDTTRSPIFKEDELTTLQQEKPKQTIIDRDLTEEEIVQKILDADLKKETKQDRLPQEQKIKEPRSPRSDMLPKGQTRDMVLSNPPYNVFHGDPINKQTTDDRQNLKGNLYPGKTDDIYKRKDTTVQRQNPEFRSDSQKDKYKPAKTYATTKQTSHPTGVNNKPGPSRSSLDERNRSTDTSVTEEDRYKPIVSRSTVEEAYQLADNIVTREEKYKPTASQRSADKWLQSIERNSGPTKELTEEEGRQGAVNVPLKSDAAWDRLRQAQKSKEQRRDIVPKDPSRDIMLTSPQKDVLRGEPVHKQTTDDRQNKMILYPDKTDDIYKQDDTKERRQNPALRSDLYEDQYRPNNTSVTTKQTNDPSGINYTPGASRNTLDERYKRKDTSVTEGERYKPIASRSKVEEAYKLPDSIVTREEKYKPTASQRTAEKWLHAIERNSGPTKELTDEKGSQGAVNVHLKSDAAWDRLRQAQKSKEQRRDIVPKDPSRDIMLTSPQKNVLRGEPVHKQTIDDKQNQKIILYPDKTDDIYKQDDTKVQRQNPALRSDLYEDQYRPNNTSVTTKQSNDPSGINYTPGASRNTLDERYRRKDTSVTEEEGYKPIASRSTVEEAYKLSDNIVTREEKYKPTASQRTAEKWLHAIERKSGPVKELTEDEGVQGAVNFPIKSEVKQDMLQKRQKGLQQESYVIPNEKDSFQHTYPPYDVIHQNVRDQMESEGKKKRTVDNRPGTVADGFQQTDSFEVNELSIKPTENKRTDEKIYKQTDTPVTMELNLNHVTNDDMNTPTDRPVTSKQERISNVDSSVSDKIHKPEDIPFKKEHIPKQTFTSSQTIDQYKPVNSHITTGSNSIFASKEQEQGRANLDTTKEQKPETMHSIFTNERRYKTTDKLADIPILDEEKDRIFKEKQRHEPEAIKSTLDKKYTQNDNHVLEDQLNIPMISRREVKERSKQVTNTPVTKDRRGKEIFEAYINERTNQPTIRETKEVPRNIETIGPKTVEEQYKPTESRRTGKEQNKPQKTLINQSQGQKTFAEKYQPNEIPAFTEQRHTPKDNRNIFDNRYTPKEINYVKHHRDTQEDILNTDDERRKPASNLNTVKEQNKYKPTESTDRNKQVRKTVVPEDLRYHETIKDERMESYSKSTDGTEKGIDRQQSIFDLPNPDDGVQVALKPTKSWCPDGDGMLLLTTPDSEEDSDEDLSFSELEKTMYSRKASPRRKSIADELEQYFSDHPESPMLSTTLLSLPKTPGMQRPQYLNTLKEENTIEDLTADNEKDKNRITKDDLYFETKSHEEKVSIPSYTTADEYNKSYGSSSEYVVADDMLSMDTKFGGELAQYQTDIYETGDRNKPNTSVEATKFGKTASIPLDHSIPYYNGICRNCGSDVTSYGTEQIIQINTNVCESHIETFRDSSGKVYYSTVKDNFHEGDKNAIAQNQNVLVNLTGNQIDQSIKGKLHDRSYSYVQCNSVCLECQKTNKPNGQINSKQQAVSKSTVSKRAQPDNVILVNIPETPENRIQKSDKMQQGNVKISFASPKKYTVVCSSSDSNLCVHHIRSSLLRKDDLDAIPSNCIKVEVSVQHFRLWKCLLIASALFILFVSMIRRTNGNGDYRDFSLFDDLCTLIHLKNFEPPPCF